MARILVIDDDPPLRKLTAIMLTRAGHDVDTARDGEEGTSFLEAGAYDLLITDLIMPNKEGIELIMECHRNMPGLPIIAVSGGGRHGDIDVLQAAADVTRTRTTRLNGIYLHNVALAKLGRACSTTPEALGFGAKRQAETAAAGAGVSDVTQPPKKLSQR